MKIKVGVIFGGETVEHEVSIISAIQAINSMDTNKYDIVPIYISKERIWYTGKMLTDIELYKDMDLLKRYAKKVCLCKKGNSYFLVNTNGLFRRNICELDICFPIVHGINVEDGTLQGYLDTVGIPYVGSRVLGASLGQDKVVMKQIFEQSDIPVVPYTWFFDSEYLTDKEEIIKKVKKIGFPVIVKPANLGSSVGISIANNVDELDEAVKDAISYDIKIVVEKVIENMVEVNCSVLGNYQNQQVGALEEVMGSDEFLSYQDKYLSGNKTKGSKGMASTNRIIPARIDEKMSEEIKETSKKVFRALNLSGVCRIDYLIDKKHKKIYVNEPNTIPGSLSFYLWESVGKTYTELLDDMINIAIKDYKNRSRKTYSFDTNILNNFGGLKGCKGKLK